MAENKLKSRFNLGTDSISKLLWQQSVPASVGLFSIVIYQVVDTIFVGRCVGSNGIASIAVVAPIAFLISSVGMALGVGGASIVSRAYGADNPEKAEQTFGNLIAMVCILAFLAVSVGILFKTPILHIFGGRGEIYPYASVYFSHLLPGLPFLAFAMLCNNLVRAEGQPLPAMIAMVIPGIINILLDALFIVQLEWGMKGAASATAISYFCSAGYLFWYVLLSGRSSYRLLVKNLKLKWEIVREVFAIGSSTLARQGVASLTVISLNNTLLAYAGELGVAAYGIVSRVTMFVFTPVFGLIQGSLPIIGFNYGAKQYPRVRRTLVLGLSSGTFICLIIFSLIYTFSDTLARTFTNDPALISASNSALKLVFLASPIIAIQALGAAYFQAIGKALPALFLTLTRQGIFLIPLVLSLPNFFQTDGIWYAFPLSDLLAMVVTLLFLWPQWKRLRD